MGQAIKAWVLLDRLRAIVTLIAVVIGAGLIIWQFVSPRPVKLDPEALNSIKEATEQIRRAAQGTEQVVKDNALFKSTIQDQIKNQTKLRDANYDLLFEEFGVDPLPKSLGLGGFGGTDGMQPQPDHLGGFHVPPDPGGPSGVQRLRDPIADQPKAADRSTPGVPGGNSHPPSEQGERPGGVAGAK